MTIQEVKDLKDKIYEIEGLLELAQLREEKLPELEPLIVERIKTLTLAVGESTPGVIEPAAPVLEAQSEEEAIEEDLDSEVYDSLEEEENKAEEVYDSQEEEEDNAEEVYDSPEAENAEEVQGWVEPTGVITELFADNEQMSVSREPEDLEIPEMQPAKRTEPKVASSKPAFTLNDRFRFRRELFNNSDAEYSSAMDLIAAMESYEEAEEYFLDDLGWSLENPEVKDFMDILRNYFN